MQKLLFLSSLIWLLASSCQSITIQNGNTCTVAGKLSAGAICSHLTDSQTHDLTFNETIDMLEPQAARTCVPVPGLNVCQDDQTTGTPMALPARAGAIFLPANDAGTLLTELRTGCRILGKHCTYGARQAITQMQKAVARAALTQ